MGEAETTSSKSRGKQFAVWIGIPIGVLITGAVLLVPPIRAAREAARRMHCM